MLAVYADMPKHSLTEETLTFSNPTGDEDVEELASYEATALKYAEGVNKVHAKN